VRYLKPGFATYFRNGSLGSTDKSDSVAEGQSTQAILI